MKGENQRRDLHLIQKTEQGDLQAKEELVCKYIPMARHIARHYYCGFFDLEDLLQEGLIGLLTAIDEYKPEKQVKFSTFAYLCIARRIYNVRKQLTGNKHRVLNEAISFHAYTNRNETRRVLDFMVSGDTGGDPARAVEEAMVGQALDTLLARHLSALEYAVINLILGGYTCSEMESLIGVNRKAVDNARTRVKSKLRRLISEYGSLLSPGLPEKARRREDLYIHTPFTLEAKQKGWSVPGALP